MTLVQLGWMQLLTMLSAVLLLVWIGVGVVCAPVLPECYKFQCLPSIDIEAPSSASVVEDITAVIILDTVMITPLLDGKGEYSER